MKKGGDEVENLRISQSINNDAAYKKFKKTRKI